MDDIKLDLDLSSIPDKSQDMDLDLSLIPDADDQEGFLNTLYQGYQGLAAGSAGVGQAAGGAMEWLGHRLPEDIGGQALAVAGKALGDYYEGQAKAWAAPKGIQGSVWRDPALMGRASWWAYNTFNVAPSLLAAVLPGAGAAKVIQVGGRSIGLTAEVIERLAMLGQSVGAGVAGGAMEGTSTYREVLKAGGSESEAANAAGLMAAFSSGLNALSFGSMFSKAGGGAVAKAGKHVFSGLVEGTTEALEEPAEELSKDMAVWIETGQKPEGTSGRMIQALLERGANVFGPAALTGMGGSAISNEATEGEPKVPFFKTKEQSGQPNRTEPAPDLAKPEPTQDQSHIDVDSKDLLPFLREDAAESLSKRFGNDAAAAVMALWDARAEVWAEEQGRTPDEWYSETFAGIVSNRAEDALGEGYDLLQATEKAGAPQGIVHPFDELPAQFEPVAALQGRAGNAAPVEIVDQAQDLPEHVQEQAGSGPVEAVWDERTGKVYMVASAISAPEQALAAWRHEQGLHRGIRGLFGVQRSEEAAGRLDVFLDETFEHFGAESFAGLAESRGLDLDNAEHRRIAAEERLANIAEKIDSGEVLADEERTLWERFADMVRAWMREKGLAEISDQDILRTITASMRWVLEGQDQGGKPNPRTLYQRASNPLDFYSPVERSVESIESKAMSAQDWANRINKIPGIKQEELEDLGLFDWLEGIKGKVSKNAVLEFIKNGGPKLEEVRKGSSANDTKFAEYQLPGGENYREVLLTVPSGLLPSALDTFEAEMKEKYGETLFEKMTDAELDKYEHLEIEKFGGKMAIGTETYRSSHWYEINVLAHVRLNDRTDAEGKRTLFIEEIQSDWHQEGRKKGYGGKLSAVNTGGRDYDIVDSSGKVVLSVRAENEAAALRFAESQRFQINKGRVLDAPFKKSWPMLAFKRVLRMAVEEGYDAVAWTPGEVQAERYDLTNHLSEVHYSGSNFEAYDHDGKAVIKRTGVSPQDLADLIGKDLAEKLMAQEPKGTLRSLSGFDLKVGGEGMKGFYDKILPKEIGKYVKKLDKDAKVGAAKLYTEVDTGTEKQEVWSLPLTDAMRDAVLAGQPLYQTAPPGPGPKGAVQFLDDGRAMLRLFETGDVTTVIHETGHILRRQLGERDLAVIETWAEVKNGAWTRKAEERFAEAFERYVYEGKAPTARLRLVFSKIKRWLVAVYRNIRNLKAAEISPEVREVFDSLLSTELQCEAARQGVPHSFKVEPEVWKVENDSPRPHPLDIEEYEDLMATAQRRAEEKIGDARRREERERLAAWRKEAKEELAQDPMFRILDAWTGVLDRGTKNERRGPGLDLEAWRDEFPDHFKDIRAKRLALFKRLDPRQPGAKPLTPEQAMISANEQAGYEMFAEPEDLADALIEMGTKKAFVDEYVNARWAEHERLVTETEDFGTDYFAIQDEALAILEVMTKRHTQRVKREQVRDKIAGFRAAELGRTRATLRREREAAHLNVRRAMHVGDKIEAHVGLNRLHEIDMHLLEVERAMAERERLDRSMKNMLRRNIGHDYQEQVRAWLERFGVTAGDTAPRQTLIEFMVMKQVWDFTDQRMIKGLLQTAPGALSVDQFRQVHLVCQQLVYFGDYENKLLASRETSDFQELVDRVVASIRTHQRRSTPRPAPSPFPEPGETETTVGKFIHGVQNFHAELLKPEFIFRALDGYKDFGAAWRAGFRPLVEAENAELEMGEQVMRELSAVFEPFKKRFRDWSKKKISIKGVPQRLTREEMIMVALNSGNEGNRTALRSGYIWTDTQIDAITAQLLPEEKALVERVWDIVDSLYPMLNETHMKITGAPLKKVEGRYFPLIFDRKLSLKADRQQAMAEQRDLFQSIYHHPKPQSGFTKERVGGRMAPQLSFSVIGRHVNSVIHYSTHAPALRDLQKLVADQDFRRAAEDALGEATYRQMMPWLQDVARRHREPLGPIERGAARLRRNTTVVALGCKVTVAAKQFLSFTQTIHKLGFVPAMRGIGQFVRHPMEAAKFVNDRSVAMRQRRRRWDREIQAMYAGFNPTAWAGCHQIKDSFFWMIGAVDALATYPTWLAAYTEAMDANGWNEEKACEYADTIVRTTQPTSAVKDLAAIQRGSEFKKLGTMFYTFFSVFYNQFAEYNARVQRGDVNVGEAFKGYFWLVLAPALLGQAISDRDVPDEPKEAAKWAAKAVIGYVLAGMPFIRDIIGPMFTGYGYQMSPVQDAMETPIRLAGAALSDKKDKVGRIAKHSVMAMGYGLGLPSRQAVITAEGIINLAQGRGDVAGLLFPQKKSKAGNGKWERKSFNR
ncbi:MAG: hypothetical protein PHV85_00515 [Desulfovibrionaceae bacterium]|nr:hypothetical protein [Desulfovibrionaceae bacterium]